MNNLIITVFETLMLICFGISWPISVIKTLKSKSIEGKSVIFTLAIVVGYVAGITAKIILSVMTHTFQYIIIVYLINIVFVVIDLVLYFVYAHKTAGGIENYKQPIGKKIGEITPANLEIKVGDNIRLEMFSNNVYDYQIKAVWKNLRGYVQYVTAKKNGKIDTKYTFERRFIDFKKILEEAEEKELSYVITVSNDSGSRTYSNLVESI